jgi:GMP synthase (glutamine-hydrolysing)
VPRRALHIVNQEGGRAGLFLPPLRDRGFEIVDVLPAEAALPDTLDGFQAVLACGGSVNPDQDDEHPWLRAEVDLLGLAVRRGIPVMGLCLGAQLLTRAIGGAVYRCQPAEVGWFDVEAAPGTGRDPVMGALPDHFRALQWHYYACELPASATVLATSPVCVQAFRAAPAAWGVQFHIETTRETLLSWAASAPDELTAAGYFPERYAAELDEFHGAHEAIGRAMGQRFADVALARAHAERAPV